MKIISKTALLISFCILLLVNILGCQSFEPKISYPEPFDWHGTMGEKRYSLRIEIEGLYWVGGNVSGISGIATNTSHYDINACVLTFDILDKDGIKVGDAIASTNSLKVGMKWRFQATFTNPFLTSFSEIRAGNIQAF